MTFESCLWIVILGLKLFLGVCLLLMVADQSIMFDSSVLAINEVVSNV